MLRWATILLVIAIIAAAFAFGGAVLAVATVAHFIFVVFLALFLGTLFLGSVGFRRK